MDSCVRLDLSDPVIRTYGKLPYHQNQVLGKKLKRKTKQMFYAYIYVRLLMVFYAILSSSFPLLSRFKLVKT